MSMLDRKAVLSLVVAVVAVGSARAWCDLPFRDIVGRVDTVALGEYRKARGEPASVVALEVYKGRPFDGPLNVDPKELEIYRPRQGSLFLLALTRNQRLVRYVEGLGACSPVNVLPLRGRKLRRHDRFNYDGGHDAMTLDQLKTDLIHHLDRERP